MSVQNGDTPRRTKLVRRLLRSPLGRGLSAAVAIIGTFMAVSGLVNVATGDWWFETLFPWTEDSNARPEIFRVFARDRGQAIEPAVNPGEAIFLNVIATDPEGDPILYEWAADEGFFITNDLSNPLSPIVIYEPPAQPGIYSVRIRVRDEVHDEFDEDTIDVTVLGAVTKEPSPERADKDPGPERTEAVTPDPPTVSKLERIRPLDYFATSITEEVLFSWTATAPPYTFSLTFVDESQAVRGPEDLMSNSVLVLLNAEGEYSWTVSDSLGNSFTATLNYRSISPDILIITPTPSDQPAIAPTADLPAIAQ